MKSTQVGVRARLIGSERAIAETPYGIIWTPTKEWEGQPVYIIGGGASLKKFDLNLLRGKKTIGCNEAMTFGPEIIDTVLFADITWFNNRMHEMMAFAAKGRIVSICPQIIPYNLPWIRKMNRIETGWGTGDTLALNLSTGAAAVNLAASLGSTKIYLLGFDVSLREGQSHWHNRYRGISTHDTFQRHLKGFKQLKGQLDQLGTIEVVNVNDGSSALHFFSSITYDQLAQELKAYESDQTDAETKSGVLVENVSP